MNFHQLLQEVVQSYAEDGISPEQINNGNCADFATVIWERFRSEVKIYSDEDMGAPEYTHTFLLYEGKYYDAEAPLGVEDWRDLPIFDRQMDEGYSPAFTNWLLS